MKKAIRDFLMAGQLRYALHLFLGHRPEAANDSALHIGCHYNSPNIVHQSFPICHQNQKHTPEAIQKTATEVPLTLLRITWSKSLI